MKHDTSPRAANELRFAPAERFVTAGLWIVAGAGAIWYGMTAKTVSETILMAAIGIAASARGILALRRYTIFNRLGGVDVAGLRRRPFTWKQVADLHVGQPPGFRQGYCIVLSLADGGELALLGTRSYAVVPSAKHHQQLLGLAGRLHTRFGVAVNKDGQ